MKLGQLLFCILLLTVFCNNLENESTNLDLCKCETEKPFGELTEVIEKQEEDSFSSGGNVSVDIPLPIKKILIDAGIKVEIDYSNNTKQDIVTLNKLRDISPEISRYEYSLGKQYCVYVKTICQNKELTRAEIVELKIKKQEENNQKIEELFLKKFVKLENSTELSDPTIPVSPPPNPVPPNNTPITPKTKDYTIIGTIKDKYTMKYLEGVIVKVRLDNQVVSDTTKADGSYKITVKGNVHDKVNITAEKEISNKVRNDKRSRAITIGVIDLEI